MFSRMKVTRALEAPASLPQYTDGALVVSRPTFTRSLLEKHERLRRLGEAATDVFCAGIEALFKRFGTKRIAERMHRVTENMQNASGDVFQAPYARLNELFIAQQARVEELTAQLSAEQVLPTQLAEQNAIIEELRGAIPVLEEHVTKQQLQIEQLEAQVEEGKAHESRANRREADIQLITAELEKQRAETAEKMRLIADLRETVKDLDELREDVANRDRLIEQLRQEIAADADKHRMHIAEHEKIVSTLQDELSPLRERVEDQLTHISQLSVEAENGKSHEARVAEQESLIKDLHDMLDAEKLLERKVTEQDLLMTELRGALSAGQGEIKHQREHAALLQRELAGSQKDNAALREKTALLETELQTVRAQVKGMEARRNAPPTPRRQGTTTPWYMNRMSSSSSGTASP